MLVDEFERAKAAPDEDYHLSTSLKALFRRLRNDRISDDELNAELDEIEEDHPLFEAVECLRNWIENEDYEDGAKPGLELFEEAYDDARNRDWHNVAVLCLDQLNQLRQETGGKQNEETVRQAVEFLEKEFTVDDINLSNFSQLVGMVVNHSSFVDEELVQRCIGVVEARRELCERERSYRNERDMLEKLIQFKQAIERDIEHEQELLVESFENEVERPDKHNLKASILGEGLNRCISFIDEEKERDWKRKIRRYNRKARDGEFAEIGLDDDEADMLQEEAEENIERIKRFFRSVPIEPDVSVYSLYCLLKSDGYLPSYEMAKSISEEGSITEVLPHVRISPEGDPIETTEGGLEDPDRLPHTYPMMLRHYNAILANALYELVEEGDLDSMDFIELLTCTRKLSVDDRAFLQDLIDAVFEERYPEAVHLGIPRLEGVVTRLLENSGEAVTGLKEGDIEQSSLGGLLDTVQDRTSIEYGKYLKARYTDKFGLNLRNRVSHGQIKYVECQFGNAALILFDIFRMIVHLSETEFNAVFGPPAVTLSKTRSDRDSI